MKKYSLFCISFLCFWISLYSCEAEKKEDVSTKKPTVILPAKDSDEILINPALLSPEAPRCTDRPRLTFLIYDETFESNICNEHHIVFVATTPLLRIQKPLVYIQDNNHKRLLSKSHGFSHGEKIIVEGTLTKTLCGFMYSNKEKVLVRLPLKCLTKPYHIVWGDFKDEGLDFVPTS